MGSDVDVTSISLHVGPESRVNPLPWYGILTRSNHERVAALVLQGKGLRTVSASLLSALASR
jgi:hypothetical protein